MSGFYKMKIGWTQIINKPEPYPYAISMRIGIEIRLNLKDKKPLTKRDDISVGTIVYIPFPGYSDKFFCTSVDEVNGDEAFATTCDGDTCATLRFCSDDRKCWLSTMVMCGFTGWEPL